MTTTITQRQLRNQSGEIMRRLDAGEVFVVSRDGVPVAELTPIRRRRFVSSDVAVATLRGLPPMDYQQLRADLDAVVDQDPTPRA